MQWWKEKGGNLLTSKLMYSRSQVLACYHRYENGEGGGTKHDSQSTKNPSSRRISNLDLVLSKLDTWRGPLFCASFPFPPACTIPRACQAVLVVKNLPATAGEIRDAGLILGSGRSPGGLWQPTPIFLPGEPHGQRSLADYSS